MVSDQFSPVLQLKKHEPIPWVMGEYQVEKPPRTPSEWFSKKFREAARKCGTPFLEAVYGSPSQSELKVQPIVMNDLFFAAILSDESLGHKVIFYVPDQCWYFKEVRDQGVFKSTTDAKLKNLLSMLLLKCAEEMPAETDKLNLFAKFRRDAQLQTVIEAAKSLFAAGRDFFGEHSENQRRGGDEHQRKVAKLFIKVVIEVGSQKSLTVSESYAAFREFCKQTGGGQIDRNLFEPIFAELVKNEYGLGLRHDVPNLLGKQQRGWKGLGLKESSSFRLPELSVLPDQLVAA